MVGATGHGLPIYAHRFVAYDGERPSHRAGLRWALVLIGLLAIRWTFRSVSGTPVTFVAIVAMSFVYVAVFLYAALNSAQTLDTFLLLPIVTVAVISGAVAFRVVEPLVRFEVRPDGQWYFRLGLIIPLLYIGILVTRLIENLFLLRIDPFQVQPPPNLPLDSVAARLVFTSNTLLAAGTGLLVGRNIAVHRAYVRVRRNTTSPGIGSQIA